MTSVIVFVGETVDYTGDQGYPHIPPECANVEVDELLPFLKSVILLVGTRKIVVSLLIFC